MPDAVCIFDASETGRDASGADDAAVLDAAADTGWTPSLVWAAGQNIGSQGISSLFATELTRILGSDDVYVAGSFGEVLQTSLALSLTASANDIGFLRLNLASGDIVEGSRFPDASTVGAPGQIFLRSADTNLSVIGGMFFGQEKFCTPSNEDCFSTALPDVPKGFIAKLRSDLTVEQAVVLEGSDSDPAIEVRGVLSMEDRVLVTGGFAGKMRVTELPGQRALLELEHLEIDNGTSHLFLLALSSASQVLSVPIGNTQGTSFGLALDRGGDNEFYSTSIFNGTLTFPGRTTTASSNTLLIQKYTETGLFWEHSFGSNVGKNSIRTQSLPGGSLVLTGFFKNRFDAPNVTFVTETPEDKSGFVMSVSDQGELNWAVQLDGPGVFARPKGITATKDYIYVVGDFSGSLNLPTGTLVAEGSEDAFIVRMKKSTGEILGGGRLGSEAILTKNGEGDLAFAVFAVSPEDSNEVIVSLSIQETVTIGETILSPGHHLLRLRYVLVQRERDSIVNRLANC